MTSQSLHKKIGLLMAVPLFLWVVTGVVFLVKPGYKEAYEQLQPKRYPLQHEFHIPPSSQWSDARMMRTILGDHLLVMVNGKPMHLDPRDLSLKAFPPRDALLAFVDDATAHNPARYGTAVAASGHTVTTNTGVEISLDWNTLRLSQSGSDTRLINTLYKVHYLQWLGQPLANAIFGAAGLLALLLLLVMGVKAYFSTRK